jgi:ankyrin repeat protein
MRKIPLRLIEIFVFLSLSGQVFGSARPQHPLVQAAASGNLEITKRLLVEGQSPYRRDSALRAATQAGHIDMIDLLIAHGSRNALSMAAEKGDRHLIQYLLAKKPDQNNLDSALHSAVKKEHKEAVELLIAQGADINSQRWDGITPLFYAVVGDPEMDFLNWHNTLFSYSFSGQLASTKRSTKTHGLVELLIKHGADVNACEPRHGLSPLHFAIYGGNIEVVKTLIHHGAKLNPDIPSRAISPLHLAVQYGDLSICRLLIQKGANVNSQLPTVSGYWIFWQLQTPLHHAVRNANIELAKMLLKHQTNANAKDMQNQTPLHLAAKCKTDDISKLLLSHNAKVNASNSKGETPLHFAAMHNRPSIVRALLSHGAKPAPTNQKGQTPQSIAVQNGSHEIVKLLTTRLGQATLRSAASIGDIEGLESLLETGMNINQIDIQGRSALHAAVKAGQVATVTWLLDHGADPNCTDDEDVTPLKIA